MGRRKRTLELQFRVTVHLRDDAIERNRALEALHGAVECLLHAGQVGGEAGRRQLVRAGGRVVEHGADLGGGHAVRRERGFEPPCASLDELGRCRFAMHLGPRLADLYARHAPPVTGDCRFHRRFGLTRALDQGLAELAPGVGRDLEVRAIRRSEVRPLRPLHLLDQPCLQGGVHDPIPSSPLHPRHQRLIGEELLPCLGHLLAEYEVPRFVRCMANGGDERLGLCIRLCHGGLRYRRRRRPRRPRFAICSPSA